MRWDWKVLLAVMLAAVAAGWLLTRSVHEPDVDVEAIDRDLTDLAAALRADDVRLDDLISPAESGIRFPSTVQYRRAADFWRPAVGDLERLGRATRKGRR